MSELREALALAAALPEIQRQQLQRLIPLLKRIPISQLADAADAIEQYRDLTFDSLMRVHSKKVRVAVWHEVDNRCQHKHYAIGNTSRERIGNIGDAEWIEAWIA
jgi:hypothetical protein